MATHRRAAVLLACLSLAALASAVDHTHINNLSNKNICATTSYWTNFPPLVSTGRSQFVNREITAGGSDVDEYTAVIGEIHVEVWVVQDSQTCTTATGKHSTAIIGSDDSVTVQNNADGQGVDVYNAGTNNKPQALGITVYSAPTFASAGPSGTLPTTARLATLQDATNPHLDLSTVLAADAVAVLVDGWITGSNGKFASGTNDRTDLNAKLGIVDQSQPIDSDGSGPDTEVDEVPAGADPNSDLANYVTASLPQSAIAPRAATFAPFPGTKQAGLIRDIISSWNIDQLDLGMRQQTLFGPSSSNPYRIDQQSNGPFPQQYNDENGNSISVQCYQVAVQVGGQVYASVIVPAGQFVSAAGVRKALFESFERSKVVPFIPAPRRYNGVYRWVLAIGTGIAGVFVLIGNG